MPNPKWTRRLPPAMVWGKVQANSPYTFSPFSAQDLVPQLRFLKCSPVFFHHDTCRPRYRVKFRLPRENPAPHWICTDLHTFPLRGQEGKGLICAPKKVGLIWPLWLSPVCGPKIGGIVYGVSMGSLVRKKKFLYTDFPKNTRGSPCVQPSVPTASCFHPLVRNPT